MLLCVKRLESIAMVAVQELSELDTGHFFNRSFSLISAVHYCTRACNYYAIYVTGIEQKLNSRYALSSMA